MSYAFTDDGGVSIVELSPSAPGTPKQDRIFGATATIKSEDTTQHDAYPNAAANINAPSNTTEPCDKCQRQRQKCVMQNGQRPCSHCRKKGAVCIPPTQDYKALQRRQRAAWEVRTAKGVSTAAPAGKTQTRVRLPSVRARASWPQTSTQTVWGDGGDKDQERGDSVLGSEVREVKRRRRSKPTPKLPINNTSQHYPSRPAAIPGNAQVNNAFDDILRQTTEPPQSQQHSQTQSVAVIRDTEAFMATFREASRRLPPKMFEGYHQTMFPDGIGRQVSKLRRMIEDFGDVEGEGGD